MNKFEEVINLLKKKNLKLGSVESMTGGGFSFSMTSVSGSSSVFKGSIVTYATELKTKLVDVDANLIKNKGVVSKEVSIEMAKGGAKALDVDVCVSITGNAGPTICENSAKVGDFYISLFINNCAKSYFFNVQGDRKTIREAGISSMCDVILENVK